MQRRRNRKIKITLFYVAVALLIASIIGAAALYMNKEKFDTRASEVSKIYEYENNKNFQFFNYNGFLTSISNEGIRAFEPSGKEKFSKVYPLSTPTISSNGDFVVVYDRGASKLSTFRGDRLFSENTINGDIITAAVNQVGFVVVASTERGYKGKVEVLNQDGQVVYQWFLTEDYILSVDISPDCRFLVATLLTTENGKSDGKLVFVDIDNEKVVKKEILPDNLCLDLRYNKGNNIVAITEMSILGYSNLGEQLWAVPFDGKKLITYSLISNNNIAVVLQNQDNTSTIASYSRDGKKIGEYQSKMPIENISQEGNTIAFSEDNSVYLLGGNGKIKHTFPLDIDVKNTYLCGGEIFVTSGNSVYYVKN